MVALSDPNEPSHFSQRGAAAGGRSWVDVVQHATHNELRLTDSIVMHGVSENPAARPRDE